MVNLYLRVFSFSLNNRGFGILLRSLSPNSPFSGSWSVITIRFGQLITNIRHFSNAHANVAASPSIGAYLHSASMQNLLPANIRCQPSGQQTGALSVVHMQYFCSSRKPFPLCSNLGQGRLLDFFRMSRYFFWQSRLWLFLNARMHLLGFRPIQNASLVWLDHEMGAWLGLVNTPKRLD